VVVVALAVVVVDGAVVVGAFDVVVAPDVAVDPAELLVEADGAVEEVAPDDDVVPGAMVPAFELDVVVDRELALGELPPPHAAASTATASNATVTRAPVPARCVLRYVQRMVSPPSAAWRLPTDERADWFDPDRRAMSVRPEPG